MIPKIIHYCWFTDKDNPKDIPDNLKTYIAGWKAKMPEYEFKLWDIRTFNVNMYKYTQEAYKLKKYAFVSDMVRMWALYTYGGIYFDTDVEVKKRFDDLLHLEAFCCFEDSEIICQSVLGCEKNNIIFKQLLDKYKSTVFIREDLGNIHDQAFLPETLTEIMYNNGLIFNNVTQNLKHITCFSNKYFSPYCPYTHSKESDYDKKYTYAVHHYSSTWWIYDHEKYLREKVFTEQVINDSINKDIIKEKNNRYERINMEFIRKKQYVFDNFYYLFIYIDNTNFYKNGEKITDNANGMPIRIMPNDIISIDRCPIDKSRQVTAIILASRLIQYKSRFLYEIKSEQNE